MDDFADALSATLVEPRSPRRPPNPCAGFGAYVAPRLIVLRPPAHYPATWQADAKRVRVYLAAAHGLANVRIWNLGGVANDYDRAFFEPEVNRNDGLDGSLESVVDVDGFARPPTFDLLVAAHVCSAIEQWLAGDPARVAVLHCWKGNVHTAVAASCALSWLDRGRGAHRTPVAALDHVRDVMSQPDACPILTASSTDNRLHRLGVPSLRRYLNYFGFLIDDVRPLSVPADGLRIARVIVNGVPPALARNSTAAAAETEGAGLARASDAGAQTWRLQIFSGGAQRPTAECVARVMARTRRDVNNGSIIFDFVHRPDLDGTESSVTAGVFLFTVTF